MKFKEFIGEMTVKIDGQRAKPIKKKYMGRKLARGMDMRNMGDYFAEKPDGSWEEIPATLVDEDTGEMVDAFGSREQKRQFKKHGALPFSKEPTRKPKTSGEKRKKAEYDKKRKKKHGPMPY